MPSRSRGTDRDAGSGVVFHVAVVAWGLVAWCQPQRCPMGIAASQAMDVRKGLAGYRQSQAGLLPPCLSLQWLARERGKNMRFDGK